MSKLWAAEVCMDEDRYTHDAWMVLSLARENSVLSGAPWVGCEHLLLALCQGSGVASLVLLSLGANAPVLSRAVSALHRSKPVQWPNPYRPLGPSMERCLKLAREEADGRGDDLVDTQHLLLGLVGASGPGASLLIAHGICPDEARLEVAQNSSRRKTWVRLTASE